MLASTARSLNAAGPPYCRNSCRMSGVFGQKFGRMYAAGSPDSSVRYSVSSALVVRQVKYVYDWWKPTLPRVCIIAGRVNASARKSTSGWRAVDVRDQPLPEPHRLGVRVVDPEHRDAVVDPAAGRPGSTSGGQPLRVVVEVQRVDVLVLLRRVLGVGDRAVGAGGEPLRVLAGPRVVGRALQRQVERHLQAAVRGRRRRTRRSPRWCPGRGGSRRGRPRRSRSPTASPGRPGRGSRVLFGPLRLTRPTGWIGGR